MMKQLIVVLAITLIAISAFAVTTQQYCSDMAEDAKKLMDARQAGVPKGILKGYNKGKKVANYMIIRAYEQPRYSTEKERQQSIERFSDKMRAECYEAQR